MFNSHELLILVENMDLNGMFSKQYGKSKVRSVQSSKLRKSLLPSGAAPKGNIDVFLVPVTDLKHSLREGTALACSCFSVSTFSVASLALQALRTTITVCGRKRWASATAGCTVQPSASSVSGPSSMPQSFLPPIR